jgi:hypothetical protein
VLGGIRIRDGAKMLQRVSEGGSGYFFADMAEKICVVRNSYATDLRTQCAMASKHGETKSETR